MTSVYAFVLLQKEEARARSAAKSTECRIRLTMDMYDLVYASVDKPEILQKLEKDFNQEIEELRKGYEYVMDLDDVNYNDNSAVDDGRNELELKDNSIHRRLLLFARINHILTEESVKEYFGRFRGSWDVDPLRGGGDSERRFA